MINSNSLHWLRVQERVQFMIAVLFGYTSEVQNRSELLTYSQNVLHRLAPQYLGPLDRVADLPGSRALRSSGTSRLVMPPVRLSTVPNRTFPVVGPRI